MTLLTDCDIEKISQTTFPEDVSERPSGQEIDRLFPLDSERQRSVLTSSDIHIVRWGRRWGFGGRAAKGAPRATSPGRRGCRARAVIIGPGSLLRELNLRSMHHGSCQRRHASQRSGRVSDEQLPPSDSTCRQLHLLNAVNLHREENCVWLPLVPASVVSTVFTNA